MSSISHTQQCNCNSSLLLNRAIALIDPSPFSEIVDHAEDSAAIGLDRVEHSSDGGPHDQCHNGTVTPEYIQNAPGATETTNEVKDIASNATSTNTTTVAIKKVRFSNSCVQQKSVSVHHVIEAYDILMHAASLLTSSINENAAQFATIDCDWKTLQLIADTYRALLIASCLLLELLPSHSSQMRATHPSGTENSQSLIKLSQNHKIRPRNECPIFHQKYSPIIPPFSPSIKKKILSTSRRCILSLQSLEKICAAKSIAQRHHNDNDSDKTFGVDSKNRNEDIHDQFFQSTSFYSGGDDIIDYERSLSDLHSDYDWHDDGFLPPPRGRNLNFGLTGTENKNDSYLFAKYAKKPSILRECCYRPQIYEGPPSSRYEKSAQTRDWIRGERIVSLRLEDYQYQEEFEPIPDNHVSDFELFSEKVDMMEGFEEDNIICDKHDDVRIEQLCDLGSGTTKNTAETDNGEFIRRRSDADFSRNNHENDECNDDEHDRQNDNDDNNDDDEGSNLFFHLSPAVLEKEEDNLWGIMFPGHTTPEQYSNNSTSKCINTKTDPSILQYGQGKRSNNKQKNMKNRQRKRRRRMEQKKALVAPQCSGSLIEPRREQFLSTSQKNDEIHNDSAISNAKEGFLLLIQDRNEDGTSACDDNSEIQARKDGKGKEYCTHTRVFVRLHPSGWLSIEDRSPRFIGNYAIDPTIDNGNISTYNQQPLPHRTRYWDYFIEPNTTSQPCVSKGTESFRFHLKGIRFLGASSLNQRCRQGEDRKSNDSMANLVFSVDDTTGGTFIDGYEWIVALSGAASEAKSLQDCILSEWEEDVLS